MSIKESSLVTIGASDLTSTDKLRVLDGDISRNISLEDFAVSIQTELEGLGFVTTSATPSNFSQIRKIQTKTSGYVLTLTDSVILCDTSAGAFVVNLPTAASAYSGGNTSGQQFTIKRITTDTNTVTITPAGADLIDGSATLVLTGPSLSSATFISDGSHWYLVD